MYTDQRYIQNLYVHLSIQSVGYVHHSCAQRSYMCKKFYLVNWISLSLKVCVRACCVCVCVNMLENNVVIHIRHKSITNCSNLTPSVARPRHTHAQGTLNSHTHTGTLKHANTHTHTHCYVRTCCQCWVGCRSRSTVGLSLQQAHTLLTPCRPWTLPPARTLA